MFKSVLVANRGEIACRVFRTARRMGVRTIAVYSEADADALHVREADEAVLMGPAAARESYLVAEKVLEAARQTGAEAIHPGYGFLSENAEFAEAVVAAGLVWIGPPPSAIRAMGLKDAAKSLMMQAGVPVTPGYQGDDQTEATLTAEAARIGYPVLIKAVAGGGGKGMKRVDRAEDFAAALASAQREAKAAFGDDRVLIETYITRPRHIEVQVFGDQTGEVVHLFERDCSLQRRHQKVIEEAPAPGMDPATREAVTSAAVRAAQAVDYVGAGTVEFIADASEGLRGDRIYFMEMNTRLQVEHPVTECVTGVDLVEWQFRVAAGEPMPLKQDQIRLNGWAMEARLYAEDPANGFLPSIGRLEHFKLPEPSPSRGEGWAGVEAGGFQFSSGGGAASGASSGNDLPSPHPPASSPSRGRGALRIDTGVEEGGEVSQFYDPMIAKIIASAATREEAAAALAEACEQVEVWPIKTNAGFLARCARHPRFVAGDVDTGFIGAEEGGLTLAATPTTKALAAAAVLITDNDEWVERPHTDERFSPWDSSPYRINAYGFRLNAPDDVRVPLHFASGSQTVMLTPPDGGFWKVQVDAETHEVRLVFSRKETSSPHVLVDGDRRFGFKRDGDEAVLLFEAGFPQAIWRHRSSASQGMASGSASDGSLRAPMPGKIVAAPAKAGETVTTGQPVVVLEAMKMEHALTAPFDGVVQAVNVAVGDQVTEATVLAVVEAQ